ncbi:unnamed protein product [Closterium sp. Naga37s-1]|nr:unnamed protein product [Closterium sp. Naga37s-1]
MASRALILVRFALLAVTSAFAQRGPPGGGPPSGQGPPGGARGGGPGGRDGPGGGPGGEPRGPPNATGSYNLLVEALLVGGDAAAGPPDSLAIVKGAACDSSASAATVLSLPFAASDWLQRAGWWLLHAEARLDAFLENADAPTVEALLALLPNASLPRSNGGGRGGRNGGGSSRGAGGARSEHGSRRMGLDVARVGRMLMRALARGPGHIATPQHN